MLVAMEVKELYIAMNVHTFVHTMNEIDPVSMQRHPRHRIGLILAHRIKLAAIGEKRP